MNIREESNEIENRKMEKNQQNKKCFFETINKTDKPLARLIPRIKMKEGHTDLTEIKRIMNKYYEQFNLD